MVVDFHTHIFPDKIAEKSVAFLASKTGFPYCYNGTEAGLLEMQNRANVDLSIALPVVTNPKQFDSVNEFAYSINAKKEGILSFGGIHPRCEDIQGKMRFLKERGFFGVKIHPDYQETFIDDNGYLEILRCANELDMIVVTHAGVDEGYPDAPIRCTPERVLKVIEEIKPKKFVLAHFGGNKLWQDVYEKLCGLDVYFDTAFALNFIDEKLFKKMLKKHGEDRILFATDAPWQEVGNNVEKLKSFRLSKKVEEKILYKNALKLLNM